MKKTDHDVQSAELLDRLNKAINDSSFIDTPEIKKSAKKNKPLTLNEKKNFSFLIALISIGYYFYKNKAKIIEAIRTEFRHELLVLEERIEKAKSGKKDSIVLMTEDEILPVEKRNNAFFE